MFTADHNINEAKGSKGKTPVVNAITAHLYQGVDQQHNSGMEVNFHRENHPIYHHPREP